jgi:Fur family ferric uptake transcriptional regulator
MSSDIEKECLKKNLKMTDQRRVVAKVLSSAHDHPNVQELYERSVKLDPSISIATVYRTLKLFEEHGIVEKHNFIGDSQSRYESANEHHDHMIDVKSGKVIEFYDADLELLKENIAKQRGYRLVEHRLELYVVPIEE